MTALILPALIHRTVLTAFILTERVVEAEPDAELSLMTLRPSKVRCYLRY